MFLTVLGILAVGFALLSIAFHLPAWLAVRWVYGRIPFSLARQMLAYAVRAPAVRFAHLLWVVLTVWAGLEWAATAGYLPEPPRLLLLGVVLFLADGLATCSLPPSVLFLSGSDPRGVASLSTLCQGLWPYRAVALLRPATDWPDPETRGWFFLGCLRTGQTFEWRTEVYHLMDVVPLIVIDQSAGTAGVQEEWDRIQARGYGDRTIVLTGPIDEATVASIRARIERTADCEERCRRQTEYTALVGMLPYHVRFDRTLYSLVSRSRWLAQREYERYLRRCKGITPSQVAGRLLEDIPSVVTVGEEERFLRESRAYDEVEILLRSALEAVQSDPGESAHYNIGNCLNNLGKLARERQCWEAALGYLTRAVCHFESLPGTRPVLAEIASAHFLLGEVYLARSRTSGSDADREWARHHLERSLAIDRSLGENGAPTRRHLAVLDAAPTRANLPEGTPPDAHLLREPTFWENPTVGMVVGLLAATLALYPALLAAAWLLGLPQDWLTYEGWETLSALQRIGVAVVAVAPCGLVMILVQVALARR